MMRIPRPKGITIKARDNRAKDVYNDLAEAFAQGLFPANSGAMSLYEFASFYNVPVHILEQKISRGLGSTLLEGGDRLAEQLEAERLRLFSSSLFRLGNSDRVLNSLIAYLAGRVLSPNSRPHPLIIKELNSSLSSSVKLTETSLKAIQMMSDALSTIEPTQAGADQEVLTRDQVLAEIEILKLNPQAFEKYLEGTPSITAKKEPKHNALSKGGSEYQKFPDVRDIPPVLDTLVLPI